MKISIIGAGSTYTPELIEGIIKKSGRLPVGELFLEDIDAEKLSAVGGLAKRMIEHAGLPTRVTLTDCLDDALRGADFVLVQIRVGKLAARLKDEKIPLSHGLIGQETVGMGGMFKAFRTIPVLMKIAERMAVLCPDAWLINFSNPSGLVAEALLNHTSVRMMGLCNVPINMMEGIRADLGLPRAEMDYFGLNHLTYVTSIRQDGKEYIGDAIARGTNALAMKNVPVTGFTPEELSAIGGIPGSYLEYYYLRDEKLKKLQAGKMRAEVCMELEEKLLAMYKSPALYEKPAELAERGGARYSEVALNLVDAIYNDTNEVQAVNVLNGDTLPFLRPTDVIEIQARVGKNGAVPVKPQNLGSEHIRSFIALMKDYERHAVAAALTGSREEAMRALLINPLMGGLHEGVAVFDEMLTAHREYLPQFFPQK